MSTRALFGAIVASAVATAAVAAESVPRDYLVLRPVVEAAQARRTTCTRYVSVDVCYDPEEVLLDLRHVVADSARIEEDQWPEPGAGFTVFVTLTPEGKRIIQGWSSENLGRRLAIFVNAELKHAPVLNGPLSGDPLIVGFCSERSEAESMLAAIRKGGSR
jgi:preprotein translocase subunit SecD